MKTFRLTVSEILVKWQMRTVQAGILEIVRAHEAGVKEAVEKAKSEPKPTCVLDCKNCHKR